MPVSRARANAFAVEVAASKLPLRGHVRSPPLQVPSHLYFLVGLTYIIYQILHKHTIVVVVQSELSQQKIPSDKIDLGALLLLLTIARSSIFFPQQW